MTLKMIKMLLPLLDSITWDTTSTFSAPRVYTFITTSKSKMIVSNVFQSYLISILRPSNASGMYISKTLTRVYTTVLLAASIKIRKESRSLKSRSKTIKKS